MAVGTHRALWHSFGLSHVHPCLRIVSAGREAGSHSEADGVVVGWEVLLRGGELGSLLGHMAHAATIIKQGRTFHTLLSLDRVPHHFIHLNAHAGADLRWWMSSFQHWNGSSFFPAVHSHPLTLFPMHRDHTAVAHSPSPTAGSSCSGQKLAPGSCHYWEAGTNSHCISFVGSLVEAWLHALQI